MAVSLAVSTQYTNVTDIQTTARAALCSLARCSRIRVGKTLIGWSLTALLAQKGYIVPCRNWSFLKSFISF